MKREREREKSEDYTQVDEMLQFSMTAFSQRGLVLAEHD